MSYDKYTWTTGETITAEKLNHIEDGIAGSGCGFEYSEESTLVFDGTIEATTQPFVSFLPLTIPTSETMFVTFNDIEYEMPKNGVEGGYVYGEIGSGSGSMPIFDTYPCAVAFVNDNPMVIVKEPSTYQVKMEERSTSVTTSEYFDKAVNKSSGIIKVKMEFVDGNFISVDKTRNEVFQFLSEGNAVLAQVKETQSNIPQTYTIPLNITSGTSINGTITRFSSSTSQTIHASGMNIRWDENSDPIFTTSSYGIQIVE